MRILTYLLLVVSLSVPSAYAEKSNASLKSNAVNLIEKGQFEEARDLLERIKGTDDSKDLLFLLGFVYLKTGMFNEAVRSFRDYEAKKPDNDEFHYYYGLSLYETSQYDAALSEFNKSALIGVKTAPSYYHSGYIYYLKNNCDKALPFFINALKEENEYNTLAHHYSGMCLYKKGFEDKSAFEASIYHFEKVADEKGPKQEEAKRYINAINEYLTEGTIRYKKRYNVGSELDIAISSHRTITPVAGMPIVGVDSGRSGTWGRFFLELGLSPMMYDTFAMFFNYGFDTDLAFSSQLNATNAQAHSPGVTFQFYNQSRTFEAYAGYRYELELLEQDKFRKITSANAFTVGFDQSVTSSWSLGLKVPVHIYSAASGILGDFSGKSIQVTLVSQNIYGATSFKIEPSMLFYMPNDTSSLGKYQHYTISAKFNLPWKVIVLWPSIKLAPGRLAANGKHTTTYDFTASLYSPVGLGMKISAFFNFKKGFVSNIWDDSTGIAFEYLFQ